uniref:ubiquitinyl hydrolase 1 n=1 Tax=Ditylenchus dipsaci TaxID=166011 RepID=A0A915CQ91_9BILA
MHSTYSFQDFFSENQIDIQQLPNLTSLEAGQSRHGLENVEHELYKILSGVTHFDENEIADLQPSCPTKWLWTFKAFDEDCDGLIDFKNSFVAFRLYVWARKCPDYVYGPNLVAQRWIFRASRDGSLLKSLLSEEERNKLSVPITQQFSLMDFVCWVAENITVTNKLIGYLGFGLNPESLRSQLEIICDVKNRFQVGDLEEWCICNNSKPRYPTLFGGTCPCPEPPLSKELHNYFARQLKLDLDSVRLWCLEVDGLKQNRMLLIADDLSSLHTLGILSNAQLLLEVRNRDMSWPEEMRKLQSEDGEHNSGWKLSKRVVNFGNTCYMSAALQSLSNIEELSAFFLDNGITDEKKIEEGGLSREYTLFLRDLLVDNKSVAPRRLKTVVSQKSSSFCDRLQHDCQEFLQIFLDLLHQDLNKALKDCKKSVSSEADEDDQLEDSQKALQSWEHHLQLDQSIVSNLFTGQVKSSLKCLQCGHLSTTFELFMCVQLPIPIDQLIFVCVNVVQGREARLRRHAFRVPATTSLSFLKDLFFDQANYSINCLDWLFIDKNGKLEMEVTQKLNDFDVLVKDLLVKGIEIYAHVSDNTSNCLSNIIAIHRKITYNSTYAIRLTDGTNVTTLGTPFFVPFNKGKTTGQQLYNEVLQCIQNFCSDNAPTNSLKSNRALDANEDTRSGFPFTLTFTTPTPCGVANVTGPSSVEDSCLAVDWKPEPLYLKYSHCTAQMKIEEDNSYAACSKAHNRALTLDHCFEDFIRPELLDSPSKCNKCEQVAEREKSLSFWRFPRVLIVHLKRFIYMPNPYLAENVIRNGESVLYNCVSIVNHHGDLNSGHYTSYIRNKKQWFFFNDSYCKPIKEDYIDKKDAYLILYQKA